MSTITTKEIAHQVRRELRTAQKTGALRNDLKVGVRTDHDSVEVTIDPSGNVLADSWLFVRESDGHYHLSEDAQSLAAQVRTLMTPATDWAAKDAHRYTFLSFRNGIMAP